MHPHADTHKRPFTVERSRGRDARRMQPPKPKRWSHQDELEKHKGKGVTVVTTTGIADQFHLLEADQFTIKIQSVEDESDIRILFKSVIAQISFP